MSGYGQFCPVAKATEVIGEKWTMLVLRELFLGTTRFNDFQRALSRMSPTLLAKRLRRLEECGIIMRKQTSGQRGYEYRLTAAGKELSPLIEVLAVWGMRWAQGQLSDDELDVELLMWDIQRRLQLDKLPDGDTVFCFIFDDLEKYKSWWLVIRDGEVDLCTEDPGLNVDLYLRSDLRSMVEIWNGDLDIKTAQRKELIKTQGDKQLAKTMADWLGISLFANTQPGDPKLKTIIADD